MFDISLLDFYKMLEDHDWYFRFSDNSKIEQKGFENYIRLINIAEEGGPEFKKLLNGFERHMFSGKPWEGERAPKPEKPFD
jgi:hypothetical protein